MNDCSGHRNVFQNDVITLSKIVNHFWSKNLKIWYSLDHTILFKYHQHVVQVLYNVWRNFRLPISCSASNGYIKCLIGKSKFAVNLQFKLFLATVANRGVANGGGGGRGGRLPPRTPKIGKESKNREGEKGGKERKKRERKRKEKREGRRERKRKGKGKGKGKEKEKKERKGKEKRRKGKREEKGERKRGKKGNEFCVKVITKLREFSIKFQNLPASEGGTSPLRHPPVRASAQLALTRHREAHQLCPPGQSGLATPLVANADIDIDPSMIFTTYLWNLNEIVWYKRNYAKFWQTKEKTKQNKKRDSETI